MGPTVTRLRCTTPKQLTKNLHNQEEKGEKINENYEKTFEMRALKNDKGKF